MLMWPYLSPFAIHLPVFADKDAFNNWLSDYAVKIEKFYNHFKIPLNICLNNTVPLPSNCPSIQMHGRHATTMLHNSVKMHYRCNKKV